MVRYNSACNLLQVAVIRLLFVFPYCLATPVLDQDLTVVSALLTSMERMVTASEDALFFVEAKSKLMISHSALSEGEKMKAN